MRLKNGDYESVQFIIDMCTQIPMFFRIWHARDFWDNLLVYQRAKSQNQNKVLQTKFVFDIYADFLSQFNLNHFCLMTNLTQFTIENVKFYKKELNNDPLLYKFISLIICQMKSIRTLTLESLRCHDAKTQRLMPIDTSNV